jgi:hypothetical protein
VVLTITGQDRDVLATTHNSAGLDTRLSIRPADACAPAIDCNDDADGFATSLIQARLTAGTWVIVADVQGASAPVDVSIDVYRNFVDDPGDRCGAALPFTGTQESGTTCGLDSDNGGECADGDTSDLEGPDRVYYVVVGGNARTVTFETCSGCTDYDASLDLRSECNTAGTTTRTACNDDQCDSACGDAQASFDADVQPGLYFLFVDGYDTQCGNYEVNAHGL